MKEKSHLFSSLQNQRYTVTAVCNVSPQVSIYGFGSTSSTWELTMNITYQELVKKLKTHFGVEAENASAATPQSYRNHLSTLNSYLAFQGKTLESRVGLEFGSGYDEKLTNYLTSIVVADRTKRDRRQQLNLVRRLFEETKTKPGAAERTTELSTVLRNALSSTGIAPKTFAKNIAISPSTMQHWLKGAIPNQRGISSLRRVEAALNLPRNSLVNLVPKESHQNTHQQPVEIAYRTQLKRRMKDTYALTEQEMSEGLKMEWRAWFEFKTMRPISKLEKGERTWRLIPPEKSLTSIKIAMIGDWSCPTANWSLQHLRRCLGWMRRSEERGGGGYSDEYVQTLAWLASPDVIEGFLKFLTERSNGKKHGGQAGFARFVNQLTRPQRGYLWRHAELRYRLPQDIQPVSVEAWQEQCAKTTDIADRWIRDSSEKNRRPAEPVSALLEEGQPLLPFLRAVEEIEQLAANAWSGGVTEARHRRNALLMAFLISNPLRLRTISTLTWTPDNRGNVYRTSSGRWRMRLYMTCLKNGVSELRNRDYDVEISDWVGERLSAYVEEFRPVLLKNVDSQYLFVATPSSKPWASLGQSFFEQTRRHIPASLGFGPHTVRHLVATNWLTQHPNDFLTVAELLNDRLETVMAEYAHLKRDTSLSRHSADIDALRASRMSR